MAPNLASSCSSQPGRFVHCSFRSLLPNFSRVDGSKSCFLMQFPAWQVCSLQFPVTSSKFFEGRWLQILLPHAVPSLAGLFIAVSGHFFYPLQLISHISINTRLVWQTTTSAP